VGFTGAGGIGTVRVAALYFDGVRVGLGAAALPPTRFRIGASGLLADIVAVLDGHVAGAAPNSGTY
jgi:hypothetical protein